MRISAIRYTEVKLPIAEKTSKCFDKILSRIKAIDQDYKNNLKNQLLMCKVKIIKPTYRRDEIWRKKK